MNQKRFKGPDEAFKSDVININNKISKVSFVTKEVDLTFLFCIFLAYGK